MSSESNNSANPGNAEQQGTGQQEQIQMHASALHASNIYAELYRNAIMTVAQELARARAGQGRPVVLDVPDVEQAVGAMTGTMTWLPPEIEKLVQSAWRYVQGTAYAALHGPPVAPSKPQVPNPPTNPSPLQTPPVNPDQAPPTQPIQAPAAPPAEEKGQASKEFPFGTGLKIYPGSPAEQKAVQAAQAAAQEAGQPASENETRDQRQSDYVGPEGPVFPVGPLPS